MIDLTPDDLYFKLLKTYDFLSDGRISLAKEELSNILNIEEEEDAPTDPKFN